MNKEGYVSYREGMWGCGEGVLETLCCDCWCSDPSASVESGRIQLKQVVSPVFTRVVHRHVRSVQP